MAEKAASKRPGDGPKRSAGQVHGRRRQRGAAPKLEGLARRIADQAQAGQDPYVDIPLRSLSNVSFNPRTRVIEMGEESQRRNFFNFNQAKRFMQTTLVASKCKELIGQDKTASI